MDIYVELDCFIDTRLGTLRRHRMVEHDKLVNNYINRVSDNFKGIPLKLFNKLYSLRDNGTLVNFAYPTPFSEFLNEAILSYKLEEAKVNGKTDVTVHINLYPYSFDKETLNKLITAVKMSLAPSTKLSIITKNTITPKDIDRKYTYVMMYNGLDWLERNLANGLLDQTPLTGVTMFTPALLTNKVDNDEDIFNHIMVTYAPLINLELISAGVMSAQIRD